MIGEAKHAVRDTNKANLEYDAMRRMVRFTVAAPAFSLNDVARTQIMPSDTFTYQNADVAEAMARFEGGRRRATHEPYDVVGELQQRDVDGGLPPNVCTALRLVGEPIDSVTYAPAASIYISNRRVSPNAFLDFGVLAPGDDDSFSSRFVARLLRAFVVRRRQEDTDHRIIVIETQIFERVGVDADVLRPSNRQPFVMAFGAREALRCEVSQWSVGGGARQTSCAQL